jgi:hypothetical protein
MQDGFRWIDAGMQFVAQELFNFPLRCIQPLRRIVQNKEVIDIANVVFGL